MKSPPLVSVIIPNYNHEKFLEQRIQSVLNQTFKDFEIIIIDDFSTDSSNEILNKYVGQPQVSHYIMNEKNSGSPFKQWYKGLKLAKGKYLWIAETDDFAENSFLEKTIIEMERDKRTVLVYTDSKIIDEFGNTLGYWSNNKNEFFKTQKWSNNYSVDGFDEILDYLLYRVTINNISAVLFNGLFFKKINFEELVKFKNAGDLYAYISLALQGNISYIASPLNNYREHLSNVSKLNSKSGIIYKERLDCFILFLDFLEKKITLLEPEKERLKKALHFFINKNVFQLFDFGCQKQLGYLIKKCRKHNIINRFQEINYIIASSLYNLKVYKSKNISKKIIKKTFYN